MDPTALAIMPPPPPKRLSREEAAQWRAICGAMRRDYFHQGVAAELLERYVVANGIARKLAQNLREIDTSDLKLFDRLSRMHCRASMLSLALATKLRLTPQSLVDRRDANRHHICRPWEV